MLQLLGIPVCVGPGTTTEVDVVGVAVVVALDVDVAMIVEVDTPTQYASSAQKPVVQSDETAGFHAWNSAAVMPNSASTVAQVSFAAQVRLLVCFTERSTYKVLPFAI